VQIGTVVGADLRVPYREPRQGVPMRSRLTLLPLAALLACGGSSDSTGPGTGGTGGTGGSSAVATTSVDMQSNKFSPTAIRVAPGATVTWTNSDGYPHNVSFAATAGSIKINDFPSGSRTLQMPSAAGTYNYTCSLHSGMNGSVTVQ
jgi:plastocyanin